MAVTVEVHNTGDPGLQAEVRAVVEHVLSDRSGDCSQENDDWRKKVTGPNAFERSYTFEGSAGEHRAEVIAVVLRKMLPRIP
jgi:hypothetical protein